MFVEGRNAHLIDKDLNSKTEDDQTEMNPGSFWQAKLE